MGNKEEGDYALKRLEHEHADQGQLEDIAQSDALATDQSALSTRYWLSLPMLGAIFSIGMGTTSSYMGFSPPAAILTYINADIGPSDNSSLFSIIWSTCSAISILLFGRISDKFGRRWFVIGASIMGFIGGIIACTAQDMNTLIGANVLLGLSGGVHSCYGLLVGEICPNRYKLVGIAICVIPAIIPTGFGAYLALSLVHYANWRWCYYIYLILMGVTILLQFVFYFPPSFQQLHGNTRTKMQEFHRIDFVGGFLLVAGLALFLLGVSWGGQPLSWSSARILGLLISGAITLICFVFWEIYSKTPNPLMPMHFFKDVRGFLCLVIIGSVAGTLYVSMSIIWPSQVVRIYGSTVTDWKTTAWLSTTIAFGIQGGIYILGSLFHIIKNIRWQLLVLMSISTAFCGALISCNRHNKGQSAAFSFLAAFPAGALELIPSVLVQMDSDDADLGTVFSVVFAMRTAIGSIMTTVFVAILSNKTPETMASIIPPRVLDAGLPSSSLTSLMAAIALDSPAAIAAVPGMTPAIEVAVANALSDAYAAAYAFVYYAAVAVGGAGLIAVLCMRDYDHELTSHVPRKIYRGGNASTKDERTDEESQAEEHTTVSQEMSQEKALQG